MTIGYNPRRDAYDALRALCAELMAWAAPEYHYSGVAVTQNFVASPHIDDRDRSHQYAVSLGDFEGGQLCIDTVDLGLGRIIALYYRLSTSHQIF